MLYASKNWTLTLKQENMLQTFERKVARGIMGLIKENNIWRRRNNREITEILREKNIVSMVRSGRIRWARHVARMENGRYSRKALEGAMQGLRIRGRPRRRWKDGLQDDLHRLNIKNWKTQRRTGPNKELLWRELRPN